MDIENQAGLGIPADFAIKQAEVTLEWQTHRSGRTTRDGTVLFPAVKEDPAARQMGRLNQVWGQIHACDPLPTTCAKRVNTLCR